jgi:hypothetical protein
MFWALLGLEALYGRGRDGLADQLRSKSEVFLGAPAAHRRVISKMYDFRSRFIHGDLDVPFQAAPFDELSGFTERLDEAELTGIALLVSSLQTLAAANQQELEFKYTLV